MGKPRNKFDRRTLLRGAGTVAIGLPFLDAMRSPRVFAAAPEPPVRALNVFFALGIPTPLQSEGYAGPLEPLEGLKNKLAIIRGIHQREADIPGTNAHTDGSLSAFTGMKPVGDLAGGPSLDQALKNASYPNGLPSGVQSSLLMGTFFRRGGAALPPHRFVRSWNADGSPVDFPKEKPVDLFSRIFGTDPVIDSGSREERLKRSVLDSVLGQYRFYKSEASNLGPASRARISDHLERVREYEQRAFRHEQSTSAGGCSVPSKPGPSTIPHGLAADPDGQGIDIGLEELVSEWRLMADLMSIAFQCDRFRFGSTTFQGAGERIRLKGRYSFEGKFIYDFDDAKDREGKSGARACSHEWWHEFSPSQQNVQLRAHAHLMMREVRYLLDRLDDPAYADENGASILENMMLTISTESGDGRHSNVPRELSGIFHAIGGANERFRTGQIIDVEDVAGLDLYNTMLEAMGVNSKLGPRSRSFSRVDQILR